MARAPRLAPPDVVEAEIVDTEYQDISELQADIDSTIAGITAEFDADENAVDYLIKVYRIKEKTGKMAWLFNITPDELPIMDRLRDEYGSGLYRTRIYKNKKLYRTLGYEIEASRTARMNYLSQAPENKTSEITLLINALQSQQTAQLNQLKELMMQFAGRQASPINPMEMMSSMMNAMIQMKTFMTPATNTAPVMGVEKYMEMFLKGIEISKDIGGGGGETNLLDVVRDLVKSDWISKAIDATAAQSAPQPPPAPHTLPAPGGIKQSPVSQPPVNKTPGDETVLKSMMIRNYVGQLVERAERDSDPELYAAFILDNVPEELIKEYIVREDLIAELSKINPKVSEHVDWFMELREAINSMFENDTEESNESRLPETPESDKPTE